MGVILGQVQAPGMLLNQESVKVSGFYHGCTCPCFEDILGKEAGIAFLITSRRHVRSYLLFTLFAS